MELIFRVVSVSHSSEAVGAVGGELLALGEEETKMPAELFQLYNK